MDDAARMSPKRRLWLERLSAGELTVTGERAHYLGHVLRLCAGDSLLLFGGDGQLALAEVRGIDAAGVHLGVETPQRQPSPGPPLTVQVS